MKGKVVSCCDLCLFPTLSSVNSESSDQEEVIIKNDKSNVSQDIRKCEWLIKHKKAHSRVKAYMCKHCSESFILKSDLNRHSLIHTHCNLCPKTFASRSDLNKHKMIHLGVKNYMCGQCNRAFIFNHDLKKHSLIHTGDKQFKCDYSECPKTFASTSALNNHKKVHYRVEAYVCKHCSESFNLKNDLKKHSLTHLYCKLCPKTFSSIQTLLKHKKIHSGVMDYVCEQCNKSFIQKGDLKKHLRIHTGEKQYKCSHWQCNYSSHFPENLKRHTLKHTGEKPHRCNACDYSAADAGAL